MRWLPQSILLSLPLLACAPAPDVGARARPARSPTRAGSRVELPGGPVVLGYAPEDFGNYTGPWKVNERPPREVTLSPFAMDRHEVTVGAWVEFLNEVAGAMAWHPLQPVLQSPAGRFEAAVDPAEPIRAVTWGEARAYCHWLGLELPTEAQWERGAHGPGTAPRIYPWGDAPADCSRANVHQGPSLCRPGPVPVGTYRDTGASPEGLWDLSGNVAEWVLDGYAETPDPGALVDPRGPEDAPLGTIRGGSYLEPTHRSRVHSRGPAPREGRSVTLGFRCAGPAGAALDAAVPAAAPAALDDVVAEGLFGARQLLLRPSGEVWVRLADGGLWSVDPADGARRLVQDGLPDLDLVPLGEELFLAEETRVLRLTEAGPVPVLSGRFHVRNLTAAAGALYFTEKVIGPASLFRLHPDTGAVDTVASLQAEGAQVTTDGDTLWVGVFRDTYQGDDPAAPDPRRATGYYRLEGEQLALVARTDLSPRQLVAQDGLLHAIAHDGPGFIETLAGGQVTRHGYAASSPRALLIEGGALYWGGSPGLYRLRLPGGLREALRVDVTVVDLKVWQGRLLYLEGPTGTLRVAAP
jgi:sulfatase modifying factor 1